MLARVRHLTVLCFALAATACGQAEAPQNAASAKPAEAPAVAPAAAPTAAAENAAPEAKAPAAPGVNVANSPPAIRVPIRTVADKTQSISFDDIKLELKKDEPYKEEKLTERVKQLIGRKVRIHGWILPTSVYTQRGIKQFVLVRDNQECCFGPGAALHDCIVVELDEGRTTNFTNRPIPVEGVFTLSEVVDPDGERTLAIYHLQASSAGE